MLFTIIANRCWPVEQSEVMQISFLSSRDVSTSYRKNNDTAVTECTKVRIGSGGETLCPCSRNFEGTPLQLVHLQVLPLHNLFSWHAYYSPNSTIYQGRLCICPACLDGACFWVADIAVFSFLYSWMWRSASQHWLIICLLINKSPGSSRNTCHLYYLFIDMIKSFASLSQVRVNGAHVQCKSSSPWHACNPLSWYKILRQFEPIPITNTKSLGLH